jgi:DNA-binding XRE family transcriptional regulator
LGTIRGKAQVNTSPGLAGGLIKRFREEDLQLSQVDLAWLADVSRGTVSNVETGRVTPDERTWQRIRTAMGWARIAIGEVRQRAEAPLLMPADAVQAIIGAILAIRNQDPEAGSQAAERWRHLVSGLTKDGGRPGTDISADLAWLADDVAQKASPERLPAIHRALQAHGWEQAAAIPAGPGDSAPDAPGLQTAIAPLTQAVSELTAQVRSLRDQTRGFDRLPFGVRDLLHEGTVLDSGIQPADTPGVTIVELIVLDDQEAGLISGPRLVDTRRRWGTILMVAKYIAQELAPDRDPEEILEALEDSLMTSRAGRRADPRHYRAGATEIPTADAHTVPAPTK